MAYTFTQAQNPLAIAEQQWATAETVTFTKFTSCIGVLGYNTTTRRVTGVHLVIISSDGTPFDAAAATQTISLLGTYNRSVIIGQTPFWEDNVPAGYNALVKGLRNLTIIPTGDGIYGGRILNGTAQTLQNGKWVNLP